MLPKIGERTRHVLQSLRTTLTELGTQFAEEPRHQIVRTTEKPGVETENSCRVCILLKCLRDHVENRGLTRPPLAHNGNGETMLSGDYTYLSSYRLGKWSSA